MAERAEREVRSDGLAGDALAIEEAGELEHLKGAKRAFKAKLSQNFDRIRAAVRREYAPGETICEAGAYGSTAFLILEGRATAFVPEASSPRGVRGRSSGSLGVLERMFSRRTRSARRDPGPVEIGDVSAYASMSCTQPPPLVILGPGDFFGIDTCINFYPREATVRAEERCVVVEMLRSVLDSVRTAGTAADRIDEAYRASAIRAQIALNPLLRGLGDGQREQLAAGAELIDPDSDGIRNGVLYEEGADADAVYLVRAGTVKLSQQRTGGEFIFTYLGRGSAFGFENVVAARQQLPLVIRCTSHPSEVAPAELKGEVTLGRSTGCDVAVPRGARAVGRRHCRFVERDGEIYLSDLDSANFTILNGERIREALVTAGDRIQIVDYEFEVVREPLDPTAGKRRVRIATASGLDNFEVVKLRAEDLKAIGGADASFRESMVAVARSLESAASQRTGAEQLLVSELVDLNLYNSQNTLLIDLDSCTRCDECVRACADAHGGVSRFTRDGPRFGKYLVTMACRSCTDPKCMVGCPVGSIRREDSLEIRIEDWCIGCQRCANQCPFGNINMVELAQPAAAEGEGPATSLRATVCDLCAGYDGPNCVYACPHDAAIRVKPASFLSPADRR